MTGGSQQLRRYRIARRDGLSTEDAAATAGITLGEALLHDKDDARDPPPEEAFELITAPTRIVGGCEVRRCEEEPEMTEGEGHNSIAAQELRLHIERWERLDEEKKGITDDQRDIMAELKGRGYDTAIVRKVIAIRKLKAGEYEEQQMILETYLHQLGMI